ncbi:MAG: hypothetical protein PHQ43_07560 [Dehalococcoidales bacterium]|nr:hypothetical protein [Dehalococcoidales bacterium]
MKSGVPGVTTALYFLDLVEVSRLFSGTMRSATYDWWIVAMDRTRNYRWPPTASK